MTPGGELARRGPSGDAGDGHQDWRSGLLAQGAARGAPVRRRGGESHRAGNRRRQGGDRPLRYRLRAGVGGHAGGNSQADAAGVIAPDADVVAVLTGNVLKDPDYIYRYHTGQLNAPDGTHRSDVRQPSGGGPERCGCDCQTPSPGWWGRFLTCAAASNRRFVGFPAPTLRNHRAPKQINPIVATALDHQSARIVTIFSTAALSGGRSSVTAFQIVFKSIRS